MAKSMEHSGKGGRKVLKEQRKRRAKMVEKEFEGTVEDEDEDEKQEEEEEEDESFERHQKMIEAVKTRKMEGKKEKKKVLFCEAYPESEFNVNPSLDSSSMGEGQISVDDLLNPLHGITGFGSVRKRMQQLQKRGMPVHAPLPTVVQEKVDRIAGYKSTREDITKWQEMVKKNREAPTLVFTKKREPTMVSTADLASKFEPVSKLEKQIAAVLQEGGVFDGDNLQEGRQLIPNKLTVQEVKERQDKLAKMRSLLFKHESNAKRIKKIKSKTFHRLLLKQQKAKAGQDGVDIELSKEQALKQEMKRAEERMTLKHKNTSRWAKRIIKRGIKAKEDGTRQAIAEQLSTHALLSRKIHSAHAESSNEESSDGEESDDTHEGDADDDNVVEKSKPRRVLAKAKFETLKVLEENQDSEIPTAGLFALPFMSRAIEKKRKEAQEEAMTALEQLEQLEEIDGNIEEGLLTFSRSEDDKKPAIDLGMESLGDSSEEETEIVANDITRVGKVVERRKKTSTTPVIEVAPSPVAVTSSIETLGLSSRLQKGDVSQTELIEMAFAGDDVEAEFDQLKSEALNEEVPKGEEPLSLPGWGQWSDTQKAKGPPAWLVREQSELKRKRNFALCKRKDANLRYVMISEKIDKKAAKFLAPDLPFPYKSKEVFEQSIRMPLGRDFNTDEAFRDMTRPSIIKDAGVIIDPINHSALKSKGEERNASPIELKKRKLVK